MARLIDADALMEVVKEEHDYIMQDPRVINQRSDKMTEFISRKYGNEGYEIIIKTTSHEHYKAAEDFARRLIDHGKPMTNADRIRAMGDKELAWFLTQRDTKESGLRLMDLGIQPTATQVKALTEECYCIWLRWLRLYAEEDL